MCRIFAVLLQVPTAVFTQPPLATVGLTEQDAIEKLGGSIDVYVSKFKPMKNTLRWVLLQMCHLKLALRWLAAG
jgi:pyruvate/2-oxoglutarate dehydrogenase complex dihydrolipoamide dehydrogenase (E3) component